MVQVTKRESALFAIASQLTSVKGDLTLEGICVVLFVKKNKCSNQLAMEYDASTFTF